MCNIIAEKIIEAVVFRFFNEFEFSVKRIADSVLVVIRISMQQTAF